MSSLPLETSRFVCLFIQRFLSFFAAIGEALIIARQRQVNYEIAKILYRTREYPNESFDYILKMLNEGSAKKL